MLTSCLLLTASAAPQAAEKIVQEWIFSRPGELQGWQPNAHLTQVAITNGALFGQAAGSDPILEFRPLLEVPASPWQCLEVRLKADRDGTAEFFWSNTTQGRYGGFSQDKTTRFSITGDNEWHTHRVFPFWQAEKKIVRLRFDLYDGAVFHVASIRILEPAMPPVAGPAAFDFTQGQQGWQGMNGAGLAAATQGLVVTARSPDSFALGPPLRLAAEEQSFVSLRLTVEKGKHATLLFATEAGHGWHRLSFPLEADGAEHTYQLDMLTAPNWRGRIIALGLHPTDAPRGGETRLRWLKVTSEPQGPPSLKASAILEDALPRAGVPITFTVRLSNTGGAPATNLQAALTLPPGMRIVSASPPDSRIASVGFGEEAELSWKLMSEKPVSGTASVRITAANAEAVRCGAPLEITPRLELPKTGYVPEPKPVRGPWEVGAYYFPGWKSAGQWQPLQRFPERKPVLGWYREGDPEIADWHIKWAVEHGITFFAYDWYWSRGARQLEHALHDGFFKARYRHLLKFCLLWANHNPPRTSSREDCLAVTRYWIENYFRRPEHLAVDGKPVVIIFSPHRLTEDLGSAGVKAAFDDMRAQCRQAGLNGLYLIACVAGAGQARQAAAEGYDAVTAYNWPGLGKTDSGMYAPFESLIEGYRRNWEHLVEQSPIPLLLPASGGWDSRPWHGENNLVRFGRTPELFKRHLQEAKRLVEIRNPQSAIRNFILVEAWNEWGEGSYIESHQEFGFGYLDAIREVFTAAPQAHQDAVPADVGLGPYDVPRPETSPTVWDFERGTEGWDNTMHCSRVRAEAGALSGETTGNDPAFFGPPMQARASEFPFVSIRMKLQRADGTLFRDTAQLFWRTGRLEESEATCARFEVIGDGQWHDYKIPVAQNPRWRGTISRLRLDPCNQPRVQVTVDFIRLSPTAK